MPRVVLALVLLLSCVPPAPARAFETRHAVVVVVDGARFSETFGDTTMAHVPRQGLTLAPLGCRGGGWNSGVTNTVPGHAAILSGTYQDLANDGSERPHLPLVFEYYRAATGACRSRTWFFSDKSKLDVMSNSDHPDYGDSLGASLDVEGATDSAVVARAKAALLGEHPALVAVNLAQTDWAAHAGDWTGYLAALQTADSLVHDLWLAIQSDTALAGRTTLFVTNDHGRHDDEHGGFAGHGDGCPGCRHVQMLALGPDFQAGFVSETRMEPVDIVPTLALLLDFPAPYSTGHVMNELLTIPIPVGADGDPGGPRLRFGTPFPNPAGGAIRLSLDVPTAGALAVDVLDVHGRRIATLERGATPAGHRSITWSGRLSGGRCAAPGAYFVRARLGDLEATTRVVLR